MTLALSLSAVGACVGAVAEGGAPTAPGQGWISSATPPVAPDAGGDVRCPHGALEDPHRGFVRCLEPGEADAGWLPPAPQPEPPPADAGAAPGDGGAPVDGGPPDAAPDGSVAAAPPAPPPAIEFKEPEFMNGDVPSVPKRLDKWSTDIAKCVADNGGVSGAAGSVKLQFLVRLRGRAEGVEILSAKGVSSEAQRCIRQFLKNKPVGTPSADPVGVTVTFSLKPVR